MLILQTTISTVSTTVRPTTIVTTTKSEEITTTAEATSAGHGACPRTLRDVGIDEVLDLRSFQRLRTGCNNIT